MNFRINYHISKKYTLERIVNRIECYSKNYSPPKFLLFAMKMAQNGWAVSIHEVKVSKYVFILKEDRLIKIRFSNHKPNRIRENQEDCDYYVGVSHKQVSTTKELINKLINNQNNNE